MINKHIIKNTLSKFEGVQTLYHYDDEKTLLKNLGYLEELNELNEWQDNLLMVNEEKRDRYCRSWENVSYGNDLCDSFMFGDELPCEDNNYEFSYILYLPNSEKDDNENEQYNQFYFVKKDIDERVIFELYFDNMADFITFWKVTSRSLVSDWKI